MKTLTHGELFAGISGFGQGFERHGIETKWHVEIDKTAQSVLRRHYPNTLLLDDVRTVGAHNLPRVDVITFGSPCQDLSVAGRRKGLAGERSGLFYEAIRIIGELKPSFAIWENVPGAFSSNNGRDFAYVLAAFLECGARDIAWATLDAQHFGVAQRRRRVFVVADFTGERAGEILFIPESGTGDFAAVRGTGEGTPATVIKGAAIGRQPHNGPQWGEFLTDDTCYTLNASEVHAVQAFTPIGHAEYTEGVGAIRATGGDAGGGSETLVAQTLASGKETVGTLLANAGTKQWLGNQEGFSGDYFITVGTLAASGAGTARPAGQGNELDFLIPTSEIAKTITSNYGKQPDNSDSSTPGNFVTNSAHGVRRLTPVECERLQGFPDNWTAQDHEGGVISDSARYRMLGNAVCANVAEWIGKRIVSAADALTSERAA